jgi:hypothetical protein
MKTNKFFIRLSYVCILLILIISCKNEEKNVLPQERENFFLQLEFSPSFNSGCNIEISTFNKSFRLVITPIQWPNVDFYNVLILPVTISNISDEDYFDFRDKIKDIDLKSLKNEGGISVDGMGIKGVYSDLYQNYSLFDFSNCYDDSKYSLLAKSVLNLSMKYSPYEPTLKVLEDIYRYYDDSFTIRKVNEYENYYRFFNGNSDKDSSRDFSDFFAKLPKNRRVIFDLSNIEYIPDNFRQNFHKYAKSNDKIIFLFQDYGKFYCGDEPSGLERFHGKNIADSYLKEGNFFFDNLRLLKFIDPDFSKKYPDSLIINKNCIEEDYDY